MALELAFDFWKQEMGGAQWECPSWPNTCSQKECGVTWLCDMAGHKWPFIWVSPESDGTKFDWLSVLETHIPYAHYLEYKISNEHWLDLGFTLSCFLLGMANLLWVTTLHFAILSLIHSKNQWFITSYSETFHKICGTFKVLKTHFVGCFSVPK